MEVVIDSNFSSLLQNLKVDDPWTPSQTWESIPSESGPPSQPNSLGGSKTSIYDLSPAISEAMLVRLVINGLQGVQSALVEIDKVSTAFCSTPADRTCHRVPTLWCRSLSTNALGKMLKSVSHSGLVFFFLRQFVNHYICPIPIGDKEELKLHPPYSLVNQAFSVAVGKVLEGYLSALNTLLASVKLRRRSLKGESGRGILNSVIHSEITFLEVYLHTEELRTHIEALGNICFPEVVHLFNIFRESLTAEAIPDFRNFPKGADLLTYLYVQLRDADPVHHALLKFLFVQSCEPYCGFIKSWIYHARIDDPYEEFFVVYSDISPTSNDTTGSGDDSYVSSIKERDGTSVPCFLKDVCCPLLRAGQQLDVLVKLLNLCSFAVNEEKAPCVLANLEDILPFWVNSPSDSTSFSNLLTFSRKDMKVLIHKREIMYKAMLAKLQFFFTKLGVMCQRLNHSVIPFDSPSLLGKNRGVDSPFPLVFDRDLNFPSTASKQGAVIVAAGYKDNYVSSTSDESVFEVEASESSEVSSLYSNEDIIDPEGFSELCHTACQPSSFLFSNLHLRHASKNPVSKTEEPLTHQESFSINSENMHHVIPLVQQHDSDGDGKLSQISVPLKFDVTKCAKRSDTFSEECKHGTFSEECKYGMCWPLGGLRKNPFVADTKCKVSKQLHFTEYNMKSVDEYVEKQEEQESCFGEIYVPFNSESDAIRTQLMNDTSGSLSSCVHRSWNCSDRYDLSISPMLTKAAWLRTVRSLRSGTTINNEGPCFQYFDFSSVGDPCKAYSESVFSSHDHGSHVEAPVFVASDVPDVRVNENSRHYVRKSLEDQSDLSSACSSIETNLLSGVLPSSASGGAGWEGSLKFSGKNVSLGAVDALTDSVGTFEIPLDVIIDTCLLQEILFQYKYVSNFAIKLLEEGFDLNGHLLALRRYHFMEVADWADSFILSLRNQKWCVIEPEQKIAKIEGLLDLALQRSSCESDLYRERLFLYMKGQNIMPQSTCPIGVNAFDFLALGYRVEWPASIIITQDALRIYAEIFSNLIQVRHAIFSLADVWHCLKAIMSSTKHSRGSHKMKDFSMVMKLRQQLNHFVSTLQQYVHSQLSDVSWCRFQHSLEHQVKDMLDLESVHMSYLAEALHICFLSSETKPVATIIKNILKSAFDFSLCFAGSGFDARSDGKDPLDVCLEIKFSKVSGIKTEFEKNLKELYILYLKSSKHGEFSLRRFWGYLNYNDYYSTTITKEIGFLHL